MLLVLLACLATSCATYRNVLMTNATTRIQPTDHIRVTTMQGEEFAFRVEAIDDSGVSGPERTFAYENLVMIERSETDVVRSLYVFALVGLALILV